MPPEQYIQQELEALRTSEPIIEHATLTDTIYGRLTSKKFRKYALNEGAEVAIKNAINTRISVNEPITFGFPFGAYKLWRFQEAPEADWAELFTMMYYARWLAPISLIYKPGIRFVFAGQEMLAEKINNLSPEETDAYKRSFNVLISFLEQYLPQNVSFSLSQLKSMYTQEQFDTTLNAATATIIDAYLAQPLDAAKQARIHMNTRVRDDQKNDPLWDRRVLAIHDALFLPGYFTEGHARTRAADIIRVFPTPLGSPTCIAVGTTKSSIAKFWVGVGGLERKDDNYAMKVLTLSQSESPTWQSASVSVPGLTGKNFSSIRIATI